MAVLACLIPCKVPIIEYNCESDCSSLDVSAMELPGQELSDEEIARRRDEVIKRMANTPPKPHSEMKIGKRKPKLGRQKNAGVQKKSKVDVAGQT